MLICDTCKTISLAGGSAICPGCGSFRPTMNYTLLDDAEKIDIIKNYTPMPDDTPIGFQQLFRWRECCLL